MIEKISKKLGRTYGLLANKSKRIQDAFTVNAKIGYEQVREQECVWCKVKHPITQLYQITDNKYFICEWCREGLGAPEALMSEKYKPYTRQIILAMLKEASESKDKYPAGYNDFIQVANTVIRKMFPDN